MTYRIDTQLRSARRSVDAIASVMADTPEARQLAAAVVIIDEASRVLTELLDEAPNLVIEWLGGDDAELPGEVPTAIQADDGSVIVPPMAVRLRIHEANTWAAAHAGMMATLLAPEPEPEPEPDDPRGPSVGVKLQTLEGEPLAAWTTYEDGTHEPAGDESAVEPADPASGTSGPAEPAEAPDGPNAPVERANAMRRRFELILADLASMRVRLVQLTTTVDEVATLALGGTISPPVTMDDATAAQLRFEQQSTVDAISDLGWHAEGDVCGAPGPDGRTCTLAAEHVSADHSDDHGPWGAR